MTTSTAVVYAPPPRLCLRICQNVYRGTSLIINRTPLGPYSTMMLRALWWPRGGGQFLMSEVPLYTEEPHPEEARLALEEAPFGFSLDHYHPH